MVQGTANRPGSRTDHLYYMDDERICLEKILFDKIVGILILSSALNLFCRSPSVSTLMSLSS